MPTPGLIRTLVFVGGALSGTLVESALAVQQATEEPRGDGGNSTGDSHTGNETPWRPPLLLLRPPPSVDRDHQGENRTTPRPTLGVIGALAFLGGVLIAKLVGEALPTRQAIPRSTPPGETRNSTSRVAENGGEGDEEEEGIKKKKMVVTLAIGAMIVMKILLEANVADLLHLSLGIGISLFFFFSFFEF